MSAVRTAAVFIVNLVPGTLAAPFRSGGLLARTAAPLLEHVLPTGVTEVVVRSGPARGLRLMIDAQHEKFYWTGTHERAVQAALNELIRPGDIVWDVGAHIGFLSLLAARLVGPMGQVIAFEPMPANRERLLESLRLNRAENVAVHQCALSASSGKRILHGHAATAMWTLMAELGDSEGVSVRCSTLDTVVLSNPPPALIKIDAEGAEVDVLRGGIKLITKHRPKVLIEFQDEQRLAEARELLAGHEFHQVDSNHWLIA